jgi:hypothetical protein
VYTVYTNIAIILFRKAHMGGIAGVARRHHSHAQNVGKGMPFGDSQLSLGYIGDIYPHVSIHRHTLPLTHQEHFAINSSRTLCH